MAKETLSIYEDDLLEFIEFLERGMTEHESSGFEITCDLKSYLEFWIKREREYLNYE